MKNKALFVVFSLLAGVFIYTQFAVPSKDRSFSSDILNIDTSTVRFIEIDPKGSAPFQLKKNDGQWNLLQDDLDVEAESSNVAALLSQLTSIKASRIVSRSPDKWKEFEVDKQNGSKVKLTDNTNKIWEIIVGKFNFDQQKKQAHTYVRTGKSNDTYLIDGFLSMTVSKDASSYRNQNILSIPTNKEVTGISYNHIPKELSMQWQKDKEIHNEADSLSIHSYVKQLVNLRGSAFADKIPKPSSLEQTIQFAFGEIEKVKLSAYVYNDSTSIIHSTQNPKNFFLCKKEDQYKKIFSDFIDTL